MGKIDIKKLKKNLSLKDYEKVLNSLGIPIMLKTNTKWIMMTGCHNKDPYAGSQKLYLYLNTMMFQCVTKCCSSFDIITLVQKRLGLLNQPNSFMNSVVYVMDILNIEQSEVSRIHNNKNVYNWEDNLAKYLRIKRGENELKVYDSSILNQLETKYPLSWLEEGISEETLAKYQIKYYERTNSTVIPCFDDKGYLIGARVRNWNPEDIEEGKKYMPLQLLDGTIYKFPTNYVFYGINYNKPVIEETGIVILAEGEKSVLKADTWFGENSNVLALFGSQIGTKRRNQLIKMGVKKVVLALDSDFHKADYDDEEYVAFEKKMLKLAEIFKGYCQVEIIYNNMGLDGYKFSPFDFDKETYEKLYENKEVIF